MVDHQHPSSLRFVSSLVAVHHGSSAKFDLPVVFVEFVGSQVGVPSHDFRLLETDCPYHPTLLISWVLVWSQCELQCSFKMYVVCGKHNVS